MREQRPSLRPGGGGKKASLLIHFFDLATSPQCQTPAFVPHPPDEQRHAADVGRLGRERRRDRGLGLRQGHPDVGGSQGPAVVGPVPAHSHPVAAVAEQRFHRQLAAYTLLLRGWEMTVLVKVLEVLSHFTRQNKDCTLTSGQLTLL